MMDKFKQSTTLRVCLADAGTHNKAILDFFFAKLGKHIFRCVDTQGEANVLLIDYDFPPARQRYETEYQQWEKPALVLSIAEVSLDNAIWLAKPLTSRALLDAAETLQLRLGSSEEGNAEESLAVTKNLVQEDLLPTNNILQRPPIQEKSTSSNLPLLNKAGGAADEDLDSSPIDSELSSAPSDVDSASSDSDEPAFTDAPQLSKEDQEKRLLNLCGEREDVNMNVDFNDLHNDDSFFLSSLKDAVRLARQCQQGVLLNFPEARIYVLPEIHRIFCSVDINSNQYDELIVTCNVQEGGKMHILSTNEIHELNDMISQQASALYDLESFVWTSTLLSAKGNLPRSLDPKKPVGLKHWPSLTRLENFPHVMPIAALWSAKAMSAFEIAKSLNIPQRYVFSFYNAANSLGLIEQDPKQLINKQSETRTKNAPKGLFSRLLKRLVGG